LHKGELPMSLKTILRAAAASCVIAAALGAGAVAGAESYGYDQSYQNDRYQSAPSHHSRHHHSARHEQGGYESSRYQSEDRQRDESMSGSRGGMESASYAPPAFQIPLTRVPNMKNALKGANVRDEDGNSVGSVRDVIDGPGGEADAIRINVGSVWGMNGKTVVVDAREFRYESVRHELTADLSKGQIESLPGVKP
jgi:PRC-barrel domain protein